MTQVFLHVIQLNDTMTCQSLHTKYLFPNINIVTQGDGIVFYSSILNSIFGCIEGSAIGNSLLIHLFFLVFFFFMTSMNALLQIAKE